jgi:fatty acid desaturase
VNASPAIESPAIDADTRFSGSPRLAGLVNDGGDTWETFRRTLAARYPTVWADIARGYALLAGGVLLHVVLTRAGGLALGLGLAPLAALWVGYWIAALSNYVHEGAHFNLHRDKRTNDRIAAWLLCPTTGTDIGRYREVHWRHHLHLGTARDAEVTYRYAPDARFVLRNLLGLQIFAVVRTQRRFAETNEVKGRGPLFALARSAALHGTVFVGAILAGWYATAVAWAVGVAIVYPLCTALRQILEHRPAEAADPLAAVNRMFGRDAFSRSFGAAGFNRHLLHHWHPSASYTCFDELEAFLMRTPLAAQIDAARTTYLATWRRLARAAAVPPR